MPLQSRSEELMARIPRAERAPVMPVSPEEEPEVESFNERGERILQEAAARVSATWTGLRSRLSSFGDRLLGATKTGIGASASGLETGATIAGRTAGGVLDVVKATPTMAKGLREHLGREVSEMSATYHDMIRPREAADMEAVSDLDLRIQRIKDVMAGIKLESARDGLVQEIYRLEDEKAKLLDTPRYTRGSKAAAEALVATKAGLRRGAGAVGTGLATGAMGVAALGMEAASGIAEGGRWVGEKVGEMREERRLEQEERRIEHEEACVARAELFLMDAAEASGEPVQKLSREQLFVLGTKLEESLARRIAGGVKELGKAVLFVDDVVDIGRNLKTGALDFAAFARSPKDRAWLMSELQSAGVEIPRALLGAGKTVGSKLIVDPAIRGRKAVGRLGAKAVAVGAGLAIAGVEAAANSGPARAAQEAAIAKWQEHGPAIEQGFASGVTSLNKFAENALDVPDGMNRAANELGSQLNTEATKAFGFFDRMRKLVDSAVAVAQRKWNEFMLEVAQGAAKTENPELVAQISDAVEALEAVEAEEARPTSSLDAPPVSRTALRRPRPQTIRPTTAS